MSGLSHEEDRHASADPWPVITLGCLFVMAGVVAWIKAGGDIFSGTIKTDRNSAKLILAAISSLVLPTGLIFLGKGLIEGRGSSFNWSRVLLWLMFVACCLKVFGVVHSIGHAFFKSDTPSGHSDIPGDWWTSLLLVVAIAVLVRWIIRQLDRWQPPQGHPGTSSRLWLCIAMASALATLPLAAKMNTLEREMGGIKAARVMISAVDASSGAPLDNLHIETTGLNPRDLCRSFSSKPVGNKMQALAELGWISDKPETWWVSSDGYERKKVAIQHEKTLEVRLDKRGN